MDPSQTNPDSIYANQRGSTNGAPQPQGQGAGPGYGPGAAPVYSVPQMQGAGYGGPPVAAYPSGGVYPPQGVAYAPPAAYPMYAPPGGFPPGTQVVYGAPPPGTPANVVYVMQQPASPVPVYTTSTNVDRSQQGSACLICFIIGFFIWIAYLPSIIISFQLVVTKKQISPSRAKAVLAFAILELIAWLFVPAFIWYSDIYCYTEINLDGYDIEVCYDFWYGWISLIVFYTFALCFGIPRVIFCYRPATETITTSVVAAVPNQNVVVLS